MRVKVARRGARPYRRRVTAWPQRGFALGAALGLSLIGLPDPAPHLRTARADGIMLVQAGAFWMGSDADAPDEQPMHRVYVRDFWLDRYKVTNREFARFLGARGLRSPEGEDYFDRDAPDARIHRRDGRFTADQGFEEHPAVEVSWFGARDYCLWRRQRLPTEAEWEKAARGQDRRRYPWGDTPPRPALAVFGRAADATDRGDRRPAGESPYRVQDLLGNLREWTASEYRAYPYRPDDGREAPAPHAPRVVRGASHDDPPEELRVTIRHVSSYDGSDGGLRHGHHHTGFRCATSEDLGGY
jgi:formylglycine-generating enzyme required for sulfatase activity